MGGVTGPVYGDKLKGLETAETVGAIKHALAKCDAVGFTGRHMDAATYHSAFVPPFMAHLGLTDVNKVPARSTLDLVYRSHLETKEVEQTKVESETYENKKDESGLESDHDNDDKSDGFVGSDSDDGAASPPVVARRLPLRRRRGAVQSAAELLREKLAPVRDALNQAKTALERPSPSRNKTRKALGALGLSGDGVLGQTEFASKFQDRDYAIKQAGRALPREHGLDFSRMSTAPAVWLELIQYHQGLGDGVLEKRIAATRQLCTDLTSKRLAVGGRNCQIQHPDIQKATVVASLKRKQINDDADAEATKSLRADDFFDDLGAVPPPQSTFYRPVLRLPSNIPEHVAEDPTQYVFALDAETQQPVLIKAGEMQEKIIFGRGSSFQLGIGNAKDQEPIGEVMRVQVGDAVLMTGDAWNGLPLGDGSFVSHRGRGGPFALCLDFRDRASTWAQGGHDDMTLARSALGIKLVSSTAVDTTVGTLEDFQHARFESTAIPGGMSALAADCEVLSEKMRVASVAAAGGEVFLAPGLQLERLGTEGTVRLNAVGYSRCAGSINSDRRMKLDFLKSEGLEALHYISLQAALLGHVQVRLVAYAHAAAGNFHPDGSIVGPIRSKRMAVSVAMAAPASLRSWNFSSGIGGAMPAHMGPAFG
jgi:hypothetical protein